MELWIALKKDIVSIRQNRKHQEDGDVVLPPDAEDIVDMVDF